MGVRFVTFYFCPASVMRVTLGYTPYPLRFVGAPCYNYLYKQRKKESNKMAKKKATDTFWGSRLNYSDVANLSKADKLALEEELNDAVMHICEAYEVA